MTDSKIYIIQHVPYEGPGKILDWFLENEKAFEEVKLYSGVSLPQVSEVGGLIIMGGPMGVYDDYEIPWIQAEKVLIKECIDHKIPVLGVCLGAQMIANVLGSDVYRHKYKEIGWFDVQQIYEGNFDSELDEYLVFHWHGDTFDLPKGAKHLFESKACTNQGFQFEDHVVALQFHIEIGQAEIDVMEDRIKESLQKGPYVQDWEKIVAVDHKHELENQNLLFNILEKLFN